MLVYWNRRTGDKLYSFDSGRHHVVYVQGARGWAIDGIDINGTWFEDRDQFNTFAAEMFADLTGMTLQEFEEVAQLLYV